jgi:mediator of RNA polymerase II transcription subunit 18
MHELLLYGQVPRARHEQVLQVLAGVAAMQPRRVLRRHIIYKPIREPEEPGSHLKRGGTQNVTAAKNTKQGGAKDLYYTQLVQQLKEDDFGRGDEQMHVDSQEGGGLWTLEFNDVPEAGDRGGVLVRGTSSTELGGNDPHAYMTSLGYQ